MLILTTFKGSWLFWVIIKVFRLFHGFRVLFTIYSLNINKYENRVFQDFKVLLISNIDHNQSLVFRSFRDFEVFLDFQCY